MTYYEEWLKKAGWRGRFWLWYYGFEISVGEWILKWVEKIRR